MVDDKIKKQFRRTKANNRERNRMRGLNNGITHNNFLAYYNKYIYVSIL